MQKEIENFEFVQGVDFEFLESLKNNGTKYLLTFDDSCEEICKPLLILLLLADIKVWVLFTFSTTCFIKANLDETLSSRTQTLFLSESPGDVMQVSGLSAQLGLRSQLDDWYRDAKSVEYGHLLIDLSPRTDDLSRYCTISGSIPSKVFISDRLKQSKLFAKKHTKSLYSPSFPIVFPEMQKSFPSVLSKRV